MNRLRSPGLAVAAAWSGSVAAVFALPERSEVWINHVQGEWTGTSAELVWTVSEARNTLGFQVYRVEKEGPILLSGAPVPFNSFEPGSSVCRQADRSQVEGAEASYRIDALQVDGSVETVGTWAVQFLEPAPMMAAMSLELPQAAAMVPSTGPALKVPVESNDLYRVSFADIAGGLGWTESAVSNAVATTNLSMRCGDTPVAYLADTDSQQIIFYGWPATNRYTHTGYFWIEPGSGIQMQRITPDNIFTASNLTFSSSVHFEEDVATLVEFDDVLRDDLYYWKLVWSPAEQPFNDIPLNGYATNDISVRVRVKGYDDNPNFSDHLAEIWFNNNKLGEMAFDGKADVAESFTADASEVLLAGNQLKVKGILQPGVTASRFVVDDFTVTYDRFYHPFGGLLRATDGGNGRLSADQFTNPLVLDVTNPFEPAWIADTNGVIPTGWSWTAATNTQWAMSEWSRVPAAAPQPAGFGSWLCDSTNRVDYLVIAPRVFEAPAQELADYRAGQGLRTAVALYEDICDQFAGGLNTPEAIRECLAYAHSNWTAAPWMVCLGGWGHYDYLGVQTSITSYLPALLGSDSATLRPADGLLADISGEDEVPDLAIGRIPVQSAAEFNGYIAKLKAYETSGVQAGHSNLLFVADNADDGGDFAATNLELGEKAGARYGCVYTTLNFASNSYNAVRTDIDDAFNAGVGVIHYTGHGSYKSLADRSKQDSQSGSPSGNVWNETDATALVNPPVPLFVSLTCIMGRFDIYSSTQRCLAEELVMNPNGGSLAVFAPSGLSWNYYAALFADAMYQLHTQDGVDTLGPLIMKARQSFGPLGGLHAQAIRTYNLLGDPALKLRGGAAGTPPSWVPNYAQWRWEKYGYAELESPVSTGSTNFNEYAFGGTSSRLAGEAGTDEIAPVSWNQRILAEDLSYRLLLSTNLLGGSWEEAPPEMSTIATPLGDGIMERVDADVPFDTKDLFMKLEVNRK